MEIVIRLSEVRKVDPRRARYMECIREVMENLKGEWTIAKSLLEDLLFEIACDALSIKPEVGFRYKVEFDEGT